MLKTNSLYTCPRVLLLIVICSFAACSKKEAPPNPERTAAPAPAPAPGPAPAPVVAPVPAPNSSSVSGALATTQGEYPGLMVAVQDLKRSANNLTLRFAIINQSTKDFAFGYNFGETSTEFGSIGGIHLIDAANKKKYFVVRDTDGACVCSRNIANIAAGSQSGLWGKF